jgi:hypothetical protein
MTGIHTSSSIIDPFALVDTEYLGRTNSAVLLALGNTSYDQTLHENKKKTEEKSCDVS